MNVGGVKKENGVWQMIEYIHQYGDQTELNVSLNRKEMLKELVPFDNDWSQYNTLKSNIKREGLCVLNERGAVGPGPALTSLLEWNKKHNTNLIETDFNKPTELYHSSLQLQKVLKDILPYCVRTHFLKLPPGGFFPPHRDQRGMNQHTFRLIVPIQECNPPCVRFMIEDRTLQWDYGKMYALNTTKQHTLFNASVDTNSIWLVINAILCEETVMFVANNLSIK